MWDAFESPTFLDSPEFAAYCESVRDAIEALGEPTIAEIKRGLPDVCHDRLADALDSLQGVGTIQTRVSGSFSRYSLRGPLQPQRKRKYTDGAIGRPADKTKPGPVMFRKGKSIAY